MRSADLFQKIKKLVSEERRIGVEILECLYEIERIKAYAELKYDSLFSFCMKELGFTEAQAFQRIQAMRAIKEIPEIKPMIQSGALSVTAASKVQIHLRQECKAGVLISRTEKLELFQQMENQSVKEVEKQLAEIRGEKTATRLMLELDEATEALWKRVKNLSAHKTQAQDIQTLQMLMEEWLKQNDPTIKRSRRDVSGSIQVKSKQSDQRKSSQKHIVETRTPARTRYIPQKIRQQVWTRDEGKCVQCGTEHALQVDHLQPFAKNGIHDTTNLRLLCRSCNLYRGIQEFGLASMRRG